MEDSVLYICVRCGNAKFFPKGSVVQCNCGGDFIWFRANNEPNVQMTSIYLNNAISVTEIDFVPEYGKEINLYAPPFRMGCVSGLYKITKVKEIQGTISFLVRIEKISEIDRTKPAFFVSIIGV